jgi:hypothetical protein
MAFYVDHTAVNIDGDEFKPAFGKQLFENFEIDASHHLCCFKVEVTQKP